eukprot:Ihof_evm5s352 gene=Ihof_evmTU5s352
MATTGEKSSRGGIPKALFLEDVETHMSGRDLDTELRGLEELHQKYKFMEQNLTAKVQQIEAKVPDLKNTLAILDMLKKKRDAEEEVTTRFELADNLFAKAKVDPTDKVCLWLGAQVMLEYDLDEAQALLDNNLKMALTSIEQTSEDAGFVREQITTTEV